MSVTAISRILDSIFFDRFYKLPTVISIDELKGDVGYSIYQTNPVSHKTRDILPSRSEANLHIYIRYYPNKDRDKVEFVVIDTWRPYYSYMNRLFPKAES